MASNLSLEALKAHLFETLEGVKNLSDPEADPCEKTTIEQAKQVVDIADAIIDVYKVQLDAAKLMQEMSSTTAQGLADVGLIDANSTKQLTQ